jgi:hypothetical protein
MEEEEEDGEPSATNSVIEGSGAERCVAFPGERAEDDGEFEIRCTSNVRPAIGASMGSSLVLSPLSAGSPSDFLPGGAISSGGLGLAGSTASPGTRIGLGTTHISVPIGGALSDSVDSPFLTSAGWDGAVSVGSGNSQDRSLSASALLSPPVAAPIDPPWTPLDVPTPSAHPFTQGSSSFAHGFDSDDRGTSRFGDLLGLGGTVPPPVTAGATSMPGAMHPRGGPGEAQLLDANFGTLEAKTAHSNALSCSAPAESPACAELAPAIAEGGEAAACSHARGDAVVTVAASMALVEFHEHADGSGHFAVNAEAAAVISAIAQPIHVISIAGGYRTGKSFLLNQLCGRPAVFRIGSSVEPCTQGIWVSVLCTDDGRHVLVLDTEGLGSYAKNETYGRATGSARWGSCCRMSVVCCTSHAACCMLGHAVRPGTMFRSSRSGCCSRLSSSSTRRVCIARSAAPKCGRALSRGDSSTRARRSALTLGWISHGPKLV